MFIKSVLKSLDKHLPTSQFTSLLEKFSKINYFHLKNTGSLLLQKNT